jgi:signal transduction histidine kinase
VPNALTNFEIESQPGFGEPAPKEIHGAEGRLSGINTTNPLARKYGQMRWMLGGASNELTNLLSAISGNVELLGSGASLQSDEQAIVEEVMRATRRCVELARELQHFGRVGLVRSRPFLPGHLIEAAASSARQLVHRSITIDTEALEEERVLVADGEVIHDVLVSRCVDAAQAIGSRTGRIWIRVRKCGDGDRLAGCADGLGRCVEFEVADNGPGLELSTEKRVALGWGPSAKDVDDSGLGEAMIRTVVRGLGGAVALHYEPGQGSTMRIQVPVNVPSKGLSGPELD